MVAINDKQKAVRLDSLFILRASHLIPKVYGVSYFMLTILIIERSADFLTSSSISTAGDSFSKQERIFSKVTIFI
jgi:hypothetical protein